MAKAPETAPAKWRERNWSKVAKKMNRKKNWAHELTTRETCICQLQHAYHFYKTETCTHCINYALYIVQCTLKSIECNAHIALCMRMLFFPSSKLFCIHFFSFSIISIICAVFSFNPFLLHVIRPKCVCDYIFRIIILIFTLRLPFIWNHNRLQFVCIYSKHEIVIFLARASYVFSLQSFPR